MNILIIQQRGWALKFGIPLAKFLKEKLPHARFAAFVFKPSTWKFIESQTFKYDFKWLGFKLDDEVLSPSFDKKYGHIDIETIEKELNIDSVWKRLIHVDRSLIYTPGKKYRYAWEKQVDDQTILNIVKVNYITVKEIFEKFSPDVIITPNFGSLFHNVLYYYAKRRNVSMWMITATKISSHSILTDDNLYRLNNVVKKYRRKNVSKDSLNFARNYINNFRCEYIAPEHLKNRKFAGEGNFWKQFIAEIFRLPVNGYRAWQNNKDPLHPKAYITIDNIPLRFQLRNRILHHIYVRKILSLNYHTPKGNESYFYLPLHVQPEVSTNLWAPYFTNQLELARQAALGLPGKYTLYIKEHPIMIGWRKPAYYKKIMGLPNVKLIHPHFTNYKLLKNSNCKGVICISGTTGFEAILLQKPIVVLSNMFYSALPHCFYLTDISKLTEVVNLIEKTDFSNDSYEESLVSFVASLKEESFEIKYGSMWGRNKEGDKTPVFNAILDKILEIKKSVSETCQHSK